jgi:hypothetical protein
LDVTLFLADSAQVAEGKLHALGIGWSHTSSPMSGPSAVGIIFHVSWDETNRRIRWTLDLLDADGNPVQIPDGAGGTQGIHVENDPEVGRPPGIKPGSAINVPFAIVLPPFALPPDNRFEWVLRVDNKDWRTAFSTRPPNERSPRG